MLASDANRQLLFGLLGIQLRIVSVANVSHALAKWSEQRESTLLDILKSDGLLDAAAAALLETAAAHHLAIVGGDARGSLETFAGSDALEGLRGVLDRTLNFPRPTEETIARRESPQFNGVISEANGQRGLDPPTRSDPPAFDGHERTLTFDASSQGPSFQILRPLAKGGLGEVFVARDTNLNREVALKLIQKTQIADPQGRARFLFEAEITGGLEHPGIVPVYALGESPDGRPFYSMRLVRGETLKERIRKFHERGNIRGQALEFRQLLNHFERVCDVVAYAHSRGVLHRDLKPSNVMLGKFGETLVVDWGLAKPIERTGEVQRSPLDELTRRPTSGSSVQGTLIGATLGTPHYMSPEQAMGQLDRIGPCSDVYSLGATLYCILTGHPPLSHVGDVGEILRRVALGDIPSALASKPEIPDTLASICKKAMAVQPEARYGSAAALAADIESWLADEPVAGVRESNAIRVSRWERRHRTFLRVSGLALIAIALVATAAALAVNWARERAEQRRKQAVELGSVAEARKREADSERDAMRRLSTRLTFDRGLSLLEQNDRRAGLLWLARSLNDADGLDAPLAHAIRTNLAAWSRSLHRLRDCLDHQGAVRSVAWDPAGRSIATASDDASARLWNPETGQPVGHPLVHAGPVLTLAYSPDGKTLATASQDQTARLWNAASGLAQGEAMQHRGPVTSLGSTSDGTTLITASGDGAVRLWDAASGQSRGTPLGHGNAVKMIAIAPDGKSLASVDKGGTAILWDLPQGRKRATIDPGAGEVAVLAFSPDSTLLALASNDNLLRLADPSTGKVKSAATAFLHSGPIQALAFSPDGKRIATGSYDTSCRIWSVPDLVPQGSKMEHRGHVWAITFNPEGTLLAVAADDDTAQIWDVVKFERYGDSLPHPKAVKAVAFSTDGRALLTGGDDNNGRIWQLGDVPAIGQPMKHTEIVSTLAARPDGKAIATASTDGTIWLWDALTTRNIAKHAGHDRALRFELAFHPSGSTLFSTGMDGFIKRWNGANLEPIEPPVKMTGWIRRLAVSPDGSTLLAGDQNGRIGFWDAKTGLSLASVAATHIAVTALTVSPDSTRFAVCNADGEARIWDLARFAPLGPVMRHSASIHSATFSPDGTRLATASYDKTARIWDATTGRPLGASLAHRAYVWSVEFSPDGSRIVTGSFDGTAQMWDAHTGRPLGEPMKQPDMIFAATFNYDASLILTFGRAPTAAIWDAQRFRPLGEPLAHEQEIFQGLFLPHRPVVATASRDRTARLWTVPTPMVGEPARIEQEMTVLTGLELGKDNVVRLLDVATWRKRRGELNSDASNR
jgi:WD40 repeat protein/serine/threonine protein kinase